MTDEKGPTAAPSVDRSRQDRAALVLAAGVVALSEVLFTIEWSSPECTRGGSDGPVAAAFGMPFPYVRWSTALSWVYVAMPHVYVLDLVILTLSALPVARAIVRRTKRPRAAVVVGMVLGSLGLAARTLMLLGLEVWWPVASIAQGDPYWRYRPVGVSSGPHYTCTPSAFWFGDPLPRAREDAASPPGR